MAGRVRFHGVNRGWVTCALHRALSSGFDWSDSLRLLLDASVLGWSSQHGERGTISYLLVEMDCHGCASAYGRITNDNQSRSFRRGEHAVARLVIQNPVLRGASAQRGRTNISATGSRSEYPARRPFMAATLTWAFEASEHNLYRFPTPPFTFAPSKQLHGCTVRRRWVRRAVKGPLVRASQEFRAPRMWFWFGVDGWCATPTRRYRWRW